MKYKSKVGFSKSGSGIFIIKTPSWFSVDEDTEELMFENVLDTEGMCTSDHFTLQENPEIDTFNMQIKLSYVDMDQDIIDGKRDLEFECGYFKNPIY